MSSTASPSFVPSPTEAAERARLLAPRRLAAVRATGLLAGAANPVLDRYSRLAARLLGVPVALVSLIDDEAQHFPGMAGLDGEPAVRRRLPVAYSLCRHVAASGAPLIVNDAREHPVHRTNLAVTELSAVAYAGVPLTTAAGDTLGALCAIDVAPRAWAPAEIEGLRDLARMAVAELETAVAFDGTTRPKADDAHAVLHRIRCRGDRLMAWVVGFHSLLALALAPAAGTWREAAVAVAAAGGGFALLAWRRPGRLVTRAWAGLALQAFCALHIYQMGGLAEMHFFFFTATTAMIVYMDPRAIWPGVLAIIAQHSLFAWWHNAGAHPGGHPFFEHRHVSLLKIGFHFGIALLQTGVASYCGELLRRRAVRDAEQHRLLHAETMALEAHVAARDEAAERLAASETRFRTVVESVDQGLLISDADERIVYANARAAEIAGRPVAELVGGVERELLAAAGEREAFVAARARQLAGEGGRYELQLARADGSRVWVEVGGVPFRDAAGAVVGTIGVLADISARKAMEAELTRQAFEDALTGLANRARFQAAAERALAAAGGAAGGTAGGAARPRVPAVLLVDLDDFKTVNDSLGHAAGDELLVLVARRLLDATRGSDMVARLGGDEFAILLGGVRADAEATRVAERVVASLAAPYVVGGRELRLGGSVGIALGHAGEAANDLLRNADLALYRAKGRGRGRWELFAPELHAAAVERLALEAELRRAIDRGELALHYQPIVQLRGGRTCGVEALVRWRHPERGLVPPSSFIPVAEATGLIAPLGRWVLREACRAAAGWATPHPGAPGAAPPSVAVNVSARQLAGADFVAEVAAALRDARLCPGRLVLEVTESVLLDDLDAALARLEAVRALGVRLALDDFGTGYSSLAYLQRLPVDLLKIDRTFTAGVTADGKRGTLARTILTLAGTLGLRTVAEGVETPEQHAELVALGCDLGQGYLYARPMDREALAALLAAEAEGAPAPAAVGEAA